VATELFLDASYAIALASSTDHHHERAVELAQRIETGDRRLVTSRAVVLEIGNALSKLRYRAAAFVLLDAIERDPNVEIVPLSEELYRQSLELYRQHQDKEWGLTDCVSFASAALPTPLRPTTISAKRGSERCSPSTKRGLATRQTSPPGQV